MRVELVAPLVWLSMVSALQQYGKTKSRHVQPNILFFLTDSMDGRLVDPLSTESKGVELPFQRDFLGTNGTNFVYGYAHNPMCIPSRTSLLTGRTSYNISVWGNNGGIAASPGGVLDESCIAESSEEECERLAKAQGNPEHIFSAFQRLGYNVTVYGRTHLGSGLLNSEPHDHQVDGKQTYAAFDFTRGSEVSRAADIREDPGEAVRSQFQEKVSLDGGDATMWELDWQVVDLCKNFIQDLPYPSEATKPFFLHCSFNIPHSPFSTNSTWLASVHADEIVLPTWPEPFPDAYHPYDSFMTTALGLEVANITLADILKLRKVYYAMCAEADAMMQSVWDALVSKGYGLHDTYVVSSSDHGEMAFDHRMIYKASMYEGSVRVPIQLAGPGVKGQRVTRVASLLDIFPTLLDMAEQSDYSKYSALAGQSLLSIAGGESVAPSNMTLSKTGGRSAVVSNYNWVEANTGAYMVRAGKWKMIYYGKTYSATKDYQTQLFNIEDDPEELNEVSADNQDIVEWLDEKLREVMDPDEVDRAVMKNVWQRVMREFPCLLNLTIESNWSDCHSIWETHVGHPNDMGLMVEEKDDQAKLLNWTKEAMALFGNSTD